MERFTNAIRKSLDSENWYGALVVALALPDICGRLESLNKESKARYVEWFTKWMQSEYTRRVGPDQKEHIFLHGEDCYALRCSLLHEGGANIEEQSARKALNDFHFIAPPLGGDTIHLNKKGTKLQLQVDVFCTQMADAVDSWCRSREDDGEFQRRAQALIVIHDSSGRIQF